MENGSELREVLCLFVTRDGKVLLSSDDGANWKFPGTVIRPTESPQEAIQRVLCSAFDITLEEDDTYLETRKEAKSAAGVQTMYHIFTTDPSNLTDAEIKHGGMQYIWSDEPASYNLNPCTRHILKLYGIL